VRGLPVYGEIGDWEEKRWSGCGGGGKKSNVPKSKEDVVGEEEKKV